MTDLEKLAQRVEALDGDDWQTRCEIATALGWTSKQVGQVIAWYAPGDPHMKAGPPKWLTSIDEALTLVPKGLVYNLGNETAFCWANVWDDTPDYDGEPYEGHASTHPCAIVAACLRAHAQLKEQNNDR